MTHPMHVFLNDRVVPWDEGKVHVSSVGFRFGTGAFEGLRGYWNDRQEQMYVLRLPEHLHRLEYSQRFMRFDTILPARTVADAVLALLRANETRENVPHHGHGVRRGVRSAAHHGSDRARDHRRPETGHSVDPNRLYRPYQLLATGAGHRDADAREVQCELPE